MGVVFHEGNHNHTGNRSSLWQRQEDSMRLARAENDGGMKKRSARERKHEEMKEKMGGIGSNSKKRKKKEE